MSRRGQFKDITTLEGLSEKERADFSYRDLKRYFKVLLYDQNPNCAGCKKPFSSLKEVTLDHILPRALGGRTRLANVQLMHPDCNNKKSDKRPKYYHPLARVPVRQNAIREQLNQQQIKKPGEPDSFTTE